MQEEKGGPTCQEFLFLHKLDAPATKRKYENHIRYQHYIDMEIEELVTDVKVMHT